jgi:hypothetical protein
MPAPDADVAVEGAGGVIGDLDDAGLAALAADGDALDSLRGAGVEVSGKLPPTQHDHINFYLDMLRTRYVAQVWAAIRICALAAMKKAQQPSQRVAIPYREALEQGTRPQAATLSASRKLNEGSAVAADTASSSFWPTTPLLRDMGFIGSSERRSNSASPLPPRRWQAIASDPASARPAALISEGRHRPRKGSRTPDAAKNADSFRTTWSKRAARG